MKNKSCQWFTVLTLLVLATINSSFATLFAQGTAFTYQGRLNVGTNAANGSYDLKFALFDTFTTGTGTQQGNLLTNNATAVSNGLFTVQLDFGNQFPGAPRWLEIGVRSNGVAVFTPLTPRQPLTPAPYAIYAESANASNLVGTVQSANLSAANIPGVALLAGGNAFTGDQTVTSGNVGIGTSSPDARLQIVGTGLSDDAMLMVQSTGGAFGPQLRLNKGGSGGDEWVFVANGIVNGPVGELQIVDSNSGSSRLAIATNGNVGIGTTSPTNKLDVQGSADFTGNVGIGTTAPNELLEIGGGRAFIGDGGGASRKGVLIQGNAGSYGRIEAFNYGSFTGLPLALNNLGHGFVGIGTTTPANTLDVQGSADFTGNVGIGILNPNDSVFGLSISNSTSSNSALLLTGNHPVATGMAIENTSSGGHRYDIFSTGNGASGGGGAFSIFDENNSATRLEISPGGNVGIGTANPGSLLTVNGGGSSAISLIGSGTNGQVDIGIASFATAYSVSAVANDAVIRQSGKGKLFLQTGSGTAAIAITTNNNVGIGTSTPNSDSLLQVKGMVRMGSETGTSEAPDRSILVRRVKSTSSATGQVVARSIGGIMTLERDGTAGGLIIKITGASGGAPVIAASGINSSGATVNFFAALSSGGGNTTTQIFTDAQKIGYCRIMFGDPANSSDMTTVELLRFVDNSGNNQPQWVGTVTSTFNQ